MLTHSKMGRNQHIIGPTSLLDHSIYDIGKILNIECGTVDCQISVLLYDFNRNFTKLPSVINDGN